MTRYCTHCGRLVSAAHYQRHTQAHRLGPTGHRSPNRNRPAQARLRRQLIARADGQCEHCGATHDLRAAHIIPLRQGGPDTPNNARLLCRTCDKATDPYAR